MSKGSGGKQGPQQRQPPLFLAKSKQMLPACRPLLRFSLDHALYSSAICASLFSSLHSTTSPSYTNTICNCCSSLSLLFLSSLLFHLHPRHSVMIALQKFQWQFMGSPPLSPTRNHNHIHIRKKTIKQRGPLGAFESSPICVFQEKCFLFLYDHVIICFCFLLGIGLGMISLVIN